MGVEAAVCAPTALEFETDTSVNDLRRFISDWNRVTDIAARLVEGPTLRTEPETPQPGRTGPRLGELLVAKHLIDEEQLLFALNEARETGDLLGIVLLRKQLIFEDELARTLSHQLSIPYVSVMRIGVDRHIVRLMPADVGERAAAIPVPRRRRRDRGRVRGSDGPGRTCGGSGALAQYPNCCQRALGHPARVAPRPATGDYH